MCLCVSFIWRSLHFFSKNFLLISYFCVIHALVLSFPYGIHFIIYVLPNYIHSIKLSSFSSVQVTQLLEERASILKFLKQHPQKQMAITAVQENDVRLVKFLLEIDYYVNVKFDADRTLLFYAITHGRLEIVKLLVEAGAIINARTKHKSFLPIHEAAYYGFSEICEYLISKGALVNGEDNNKMTTLHFAASRGHLPCVEILVRNGANTAAKNSEGYTAEDLACKKDHRNILSFLMNNKGN